ncbi:DUF397 domain-containing protein [Streptomyces sp. NPDC048172]|uniref:DUF397 domain-containing protein n=1 Tax=Streptomyces sp. NPDC048172 TaxID=3365505 RepID=UPI003716F50A
MPTSSLERALTWRKSSYSDAQGGSCLEVSDDVPGAVPVRDSKAPENGTLLFSGAAWSAFVRACQ